MSITEQKILKICKKCEVLTDFTGLKNKVTCKKCISERNRERYQTKEGVFKRIYGNQKEKSKRRGHKPPQYTKDELIQWGITQSNFEELYAAWIESEYCQDLRPSVDRLDDSKGYSFDNIQLITWKENNVKGSQDSFNGVNKSNLKPIYQYSIEGQYIREYYSTSFAAREMNLHPSTLRRAVSKNTCGGKFRWSFEKLDQLLEPMAFNTRTMHLHLAHSGS